uniref:Ig-like domain-containing protein n=1 Tax=Xiphophorus couchianus TaxID=32473 RepID=A0A3B5KTM2_9TELE
FRGLITYLVQCRCVLAFSELSQTVNLTCKVLGFDNGLFFWYKINHGLMVQTVAGGSFNKVKLEQHFLNSRFESKKVEDTYCLIIKNVSKEDEATYFCQAGAAYKMTFVNGTNLVVNGKIFSFCSVLPGTEVTLHCSLLSEKKKKESTDQCADKHDVFWFRAESKSNPGFIYADKKRCSTQAGSSCEYRLTKTIRNSLDAGTYYCAVVTCGEILFGEGIKVETKLFLYAIVLLGGLLACSVLVNITLMSQRRKPKRHCENRIGRFVVCI